MEGRNGGTRCTTGTGQGCAVLREKGSRDSDTFQLRRTEVLRVRVWRPHEPSRATANGARSSESIQEGKQAAALDAEAMKFKSGPTVLCGIHSVRPWKSSPAQRKIADYGIPLVSADEIAVPQFVTMVEHEEVVHRFALKKIPRTRHQPPEQHRVIFEPAGTHEYHPFRLLDHAAHAEQASIQYFIALPAGKVVPHHDIDRAKFVLEREEDHPGGGARTLTADHQAGHPHCFFMRPGLQAVRGTKVQTREPRAQQGERMATEREAELGISGDEVFALGGRAQQGAGLVDRHLAHEVALVARTEHVPARKVTMPGARGAGAGRGAGIAVPAR